MFDFFVINSIFNAQPSNFHIFRRPCAVPKTRMAEYITESLSREVSPRFIRKSKLKDDSTENQSQQSKYVLTANPILSPKLSIYSHSISFDFIPFQLSSSHPIKSISLEIYSQNNLHPGNSEFCFLSR